MSASPTRVRVDATVAVVPVVEEGNRVLASIGRQESLRSLLAFSDLHENIRNERAGAKAAPNQDLDQSERFVLHEVLQLICDRAKKLTQADGVLVAFAEGKEIVCRASAGSIPVPHGIRLNAESAPLRECLASGKILRCDDVTQDARYEGDLTRELGARSVVLVPLRGRVERIGVLQAFSAATWSFTDEDIRSLDLFAELLLAALKPEDEDRRFHWLSNVAGDLLGSAGETQQVATAPPRLAFHFSPAKMQRVDTTAEVAEQAAADQATETELVHADPIQENAETATVITAGSVVAHTMSGAETVNPTPDIETLTRPIVVQVAKVELADQELEPSEPSYTFAAAEAAEVEALENWMGTSTPSASEESAETSPSTSTFWSTISFPFASRPGFSLVAGLVTVAALFATGVWWGMQVHGRASDAKVASAPRSVTTPSAPDVSGPNQAPAAISSSENSPSLGSASATDNLLGIAPSMSDSVAPVSAEKLASLPKVTGLRHWSSSMGSTVVIDLQDQVNYEVHRLMSPERIYFDLHDTSLTSDLDGKTMDVGDASLTRLRVAQPVAGVTRIVLDTKDGSNFSVSMESNPYRLVVELRDSAKIGSARSAASTVGVAPATPSTPKAAHDTPLLADISPRVVPARTGKFRIVLDAGHGGWDLGTVGRQGLLEKDLVLDVSKRLGRLLSSRLGADVEFTRSGDDYLPLDQRADFANQARADLFVSVHANYSNSANARGVETYYTNVFSAPGSKEVEKHADGASAQPTPVSLSASSLHEKTEESRKLAASVQRSLYATLAAKSPDIRDRGTKGASFVVLTGTTMPAILTEISFVSSPADEHNLQSEAYRQQIAEALYKGIAHYEEASPRSKIAQLQTGTARR